MPTIDCPACLGRGDIRPHPYRPSRTCPVCRGCGLVPEEGLTAGLDRLLVDLGREPQDGWEPAGRGKVVDGVCVFDAPVLAELC